jgi:hypothetical protein
VDGIESRVAEHAEGYYGALLSQHGPTPLGMGWNSVEAQEIRFEKLLKIRESCGAEEPISINDYGSGCGGLAGYLLERGERFRYTGFDVARNVVEEGRKLYAGIEGVRFTTEFEDVSPADFSIASGVLNLKLEIPDDEWRSYALRTIDRLAALSTRGFAFNMLTSYSDPERMRADLYYADPSFFFDYCMRRFSRRVALLHDYDLFDFTMLVPLSERNHPSR